MASDPDTGLARFLSIAASHPLLTSTEEVTLARKWRNDGNDDARKKLLLHNIRLVVSIARGFTGRGLPLEDLIQAGIIGLDRATRKFDPERGYKLSTYATWWIRQSVQRAVAADGKTIRVPNQVATRRLQIDSVLRDNPGISYVDLAARLECTPAQVVRALKTAEVVASLDGTQSDDVQSLLEKLPDTSNEQPGESHNDDNYLVREALDELSPLQRRVVELQYGFDGDELTIQEISLFLKIPLPIVQTALRESLVRLRIIL